MLVSAHIIMASTTCLILTLFLATSLVSADKATESPISLTSLFDDLNDKFQNATHTLEDILGVDIPSTQAEVKTALEENFNKLKTQAETLQKQVEEYSKTRTSVSEVLTQVQTKINQTVEDFGKRNPDAGKLLEQLKTGYNNLLDVTKKVNDVVEQQAGSASQDLKNLADQAKTELSKAATQLQNTVQGVIADKKKP